MNSTAIGTMIVSAALSLSDAGASGLALTVYNQDYAVVRETVRLDLDRGMNQIAYSGVTAHLEPDSVILRDPSGSRSLRIAEQSFRNDPVTSGLLLNVYEGKEIDFLTPGKKLVKGRIIRSGYVPHYSAMNRYGQQYRRRQQMMGYGAQNQPIIEVDGKLRFRMPGEPIFPELADDSILRPTLNWQIESDAPGSFDAELAYVTGGMSWEANYNLVAPEQGDTVDIIGWITVDNQSGKSFPDTRLKFVAGDVHKVRDADVQLSRARELSSSSSRLQPPVDEKTFDEYHLYSLNRTTTLRDRETKQIEFVRASKVKSSRFYVYDGAKFDHQIRRRQDFRNNAQYGTQSNTKVWVMRSFENVQDNELGIPLPRGRLRFYRQDSDGHPEFTGEDFIDHTPRDEKVRVYTGNAFDLVGERTQTNFRNISGNKELFESIEVRLRNRKEQPVEIRVVEHLFRWVNWEITESSQKHQKTDGNTIEFRPSIQPGEESVITYTVRYWW